MALADSPGSPAPEPSTRAPARRAAQARLRQAELAVVVVNFCQWRNTARLVTQLRRSHAVRTGTAEIVVVDNHSPFHPVVRKLHKLSGVTIRRYSRNHGFARAVNRGAKTAREHPGRHPAECPWVLLLNPDVTVPDGFIDEALAVAQRLSETDRTAGVVGFRLRNRDGTGQASAGPFPTLFNTVAGLIWGEAGLRQVWAAVRGDGDSARCHGQLRRLVGDVCRGRAVDIRKRIRRAAAFLDPVAAEQDGRTS